MKNKPVRSTRNESNKVRRGGSIKGDEILNLRIDLETMTAEALYAKYFSTPSRTVRDMR